MMSGRYPKRLTRIFPFAAQPKKKSCIARAVRNRRAPAGLGRVLAAAVAAVAAGGLIAHLLQAPARPGPYFCGSVNFSNTAPEQALFAPARETVYAAGGSVVRMDANPGLRPDEREQAHQIRPDKDKGLLFLSGSKVCIATAEGPVRLSPLGRSAAPLLQPSLGIVGLDPFQANLFAPVESFNTDMPPLLYGEETGASGAPVRWRWRDGDYLRKEERQCNLRGETHLAGLRKLIRTAGLPLPGAHYSMNAGRYRDLVSLYADQFNQAASLVLAIMHTESNFNPIAVSPAHALGLMQIVPHTAGNEVYAFLKGYQGTPTREVLFTPEHNIQYGTAYLHLLSQRYFGGVHNAASRQMCVIAAYNCGPGGVLRHFDGNQDVAIDRINALSPMQLYNVLTTELPFAETRRYVQVVMGRMREYSGYY